MTDELALLSRPQLNSVAKHSCSWDRHEAENEAITSYFLCHCTK